MLKEQLQYLEINRKLNHIMTAITDLQAAITTLTASISSEISALQAAQATNDSAAIEASVSNLNALNTHLQASLAPAVPTPTVPVTAPTTTVAG